MVEKMTEHLTSKPRKAQPQQQGQKPQVVQNEPFNIQKSLEELSNRRSSIWNDFLGHVSVLHDNLPTCFGLSKLKLMRDVEGVVGALDQVSITLLRAANHRLCYIRWKAMEKFMRSLVNCRLT
jgi:hypothetical protein